RGHGWKSPIGMIEVQTGQGRERLEAAERGEPAADAGTSVPLPPLQEMQDVKVPDEQSLKRQVEIGGVADIGQLHPPMKKVHPAMGGVVSRGELAGEALEPGSSVRATGDALQGFGVELELSFPSLDAVKDAM